MGRSKVIIVKSRYVILAVMAVVLMSAVPVSSEEGELVWCIHEYEPDDEFEKCSSIEDAATLMPGECGMLSIMKGDYKEDDDDYSWKACSYLFNLGEKAYVGQVCVAKGWMSNSPTREELNLPPCEENPPVEGSPMINEGMIPGLKKPKFESEAEVDELNVSLLECPEEGGVDAANYENMAEYVETTILYYENFLKFFKELNNDLQIVYTAVKKQCSTCESSLESFNEKYAICGMPENEMEDLPAPTICWNVAKPFCERGSVCNEGSGGQAGMVKMCPMCEAIPCNYGKECEKGVPGPDGECWSNENFCGTDDTIGSPGDDFGAAGCNPKPDPATVDMGGCCMEASVICQAKFGAFLNAWGEWNEMQQQTPTPDEEPQPPTCTDIYSFKDEACFQDSASHIIAEAWRTLVTEKSKRAVVAPVGVRECEKKLADLRDICEMDKDEIACNVEKDMKKTLKYLKNLLTQMPKAIAELKKVKTKFQTSINQGASYVEIKKNMDELVAIMGNIDKLEKSGDEEELDTDKFQKLLTKLVKFFQTSEFFTDLTKKHSWNAVACKLDAAGCELAFPGGTPKEMKHKGDGCDKWGAFCSRWNVIPGGGGQSGNEQSFAMTTMMMSGNAEGAPILGCGGYRGGCTHVPQMFHWKDQNMDEWGEVHMEALQEFRELDLRDMFVDSGDCFRHKIPTVSMCEDICKSCHGTSIAHCHAQLGLCVCRLGTEWKTTAYECQEPIHNDTDKAQFQACCEAMYADVSAPTSGTGIPHVVYKPGGGTANRQCVVGMDENCLFDKELCPTPDHVLNAGPLYDYCQTSTSETGLCCKFGFEEKPITYSCAESASCRKGCQEKFRGNPQRVDACTARCMTAEVSCEQQCLTQSLDIREERRCIYECWKQEQEEMPEYTFDCIRNCRPDEKDEKVQEVCQRICKALAPELDVRLSALRGESDVQAFYAGEDIRFKAAVDNKGFLPFRGRAEVKLRLFDSCDCPPCPEGVVCECACDDQFSAILATIPVPLVEPGESSVLLSDPKGVDEGLAGKTVQPVMELYDEDNRLIRSAQGPISKVLEMGKVAIQDAWFVVDGERDTKAYAGSKIKGAIKVKSVLFPITVYVSMVDADGNEIEGSRSAIEIEDVLDGSQLETLEVETPAQYVGFVLRLHVEAMDEDNTTVIAETLTEQGLASDACAGDVMTAWCQKETVDFRMDYPDAYLEIRRPELKLNEAVFETKDGLSSAVMYEATEVRASIKLTDIATIPFEGMVTISALDSWSVEVEGSSRQVDITLAGKQDTTAWSEYFTAQPGNTYVIMVRGTDHQGREWAIVPTASGLVNPELFPLARLEAKEKTLVQGEATYIYSSISYSDCNIQVACEECLPTCTLWLHRKSCTIKSDPGTCACECISSAT